MKKGPLPTELISPKGDLRATTPTDLPPTDDQTTPIRETTVTFKCGHEGRTFYAVRIYGMTIYLSSQQLNEQEECSDCVIHRIVGSSIRCAVCGWPIRNSEPVALYQAQKGFRPDATQINHDDRTCVIGCMHCVPGREFISGIWLENRFVSEAEMEAAMVEEIVADIMGSNHNCDACPAKDVCPSRHTRGKCDSPDGEPVPS
jgi:hypothetical protein